MTEYPKLDFSQLLTPGVKYAVRCESEDEARWLISSLKEEYPEKTGSWSDRYTWWHEDNHGMSGGRMYFPHLNGCGAFNGLMCGTRTWAIENGYQTVTFQSLVMEDELTAGNDMSIEEFFGM